MKKVLSDITGQTFGRWVVISRSCNYLTSATWNCRCQCGTERVVMGGSLRLGKSLSCGCLKVEFSKHNQSDKREFRTWFGMHQRCSNPKEPRFPRYGGRGISVCERWMYFSNFLSDMGKRPVGMSIERKNNDGNYEPDNCIWANATTQARNRRNNRIITIGTVSQTTKEWAIDLGIPPYVVYSRLALGWPIDLALFTKPTAKPRATAT